MTGAISDGSQASVSGQGRRRPRQPVPRTRRVEVTLTREEYTVIQAAARRAGLARRAYIAQAVLAAAANGGPLGDRESLRRALIELMRAAGLVRRIGTNINQAAAKLNATGQPAGNLPGYAAGIIRRADHIDAVADTVRKALGKARGGGWVIGKISTPRGEHVEPLLYYLFGPGRHEEHADPHIVAGWRRPASLEPALRPDGKRDFATLTGLLKQPQAALGERGYPRPAWHCSMRAAPGDRMLSDDEWAAIAHEVMHRTGLSPYGQEDQAVRWIAVRHGEDHIHLVAMLARQDGGKPTLSWERYKVRAACLAAEQRYGLRSTAPADRTAARRPTRAENEKAARRGLDEAPRITLRRQVTTAAAAAGSEQEFFARLDQVGVLVRKRFSTRNPGQVTGYAVALPGDTAKNAGPVWYGGGKLAPDLSWPKLRHRWTPYRVTPGAGRLTTGQRNAVWDHAARVAADAAAQIRNLAGTDPAASADAVWATSDTLHVAAAVLGSRILRQAADAYDRAARPPHGRIPPPTPAGNQLRQAARLLSAFAYLTGDRSMAPIMLITRLAALAEAVAELRDAQQHAAQAAAARAAAGRLYAAARPAPPAHPRPAQRASTAAQLARLSFPQSPRPATPGQPGPAPGGPPPVRRPPPPRPRGPTR